MKMTLDETETTERINNAAQEQARRAIMQRDAVGIVRTLFSHGVQFQMDAATDWVKLETDNPTDGARMEAALLTGVNPIIGKWMLTDEPFDASFYIVKLTTGVK